MHFPKAKATAVFYPTEKSPLWCACVHTDLLSHQSITCTVFFSMYLRDEVIDQGVEELVLVKCYGTARNSILRGTQRITLFSFSVFFFVFFFCFCFFRVCVFFVFFGVFFLASTVRHVTLLVTSAVRQVMLLVTSAVKQVMSLLMFAVRRVMLIVTSAVRHVMS